MLTWSAPTRKQPRRPAWLTRRISSGPAGKVVSRPSGIGCDIPGASGVTVSIVGLGGDAIPAEPASSAADETGGFEVVVPGVTAGDRAVVRVVLGGAERTRPADGSESRHLHRPVRRP